MLRHKLTNHSYQINGHHHLVNFQKNLTLHMEELIKAIKMIKHMKLDHVLSPLMFMLHIQNIFRRVSCNIYEIWVMTYDSSKERYLKKWKLELSVVKLRRQYQICICWQEINPSEKRKRTSLDYTIKRAYLFSCASWYTNHLMIILL